MRALVAAGVVRGRKSASFRVAFALLPAAATDIAQGEVKEESEMNRKPTNKQVPQQRLMLTKETLKDLRPKETIRGGFIMKDSVIVKTSTR